MLGHAIGKYYDVYERQLEACQATLEAAPWSTEAARRAFPDFACPSCQSALVRWRGTKADTTVDIELFCAACGAEVDIGEVMAPALEEAFAGESYLLPRMVVIRLSVNARSAGRRPTSLRKAIAQHATS